MVGFEVTVTQLRTFVLSLFVKANVLNVEV
jgi:hypothetical protein